MDACCVQTASKASSGKGIARASPCRYVRRESSLSRLATQIGNFTVRRREIETGHVAAIGVGQMAGRPANAATQIQNALAGTEIQLRRQFPCSFPAPYMKLIEGRRIFRTKRCITGAQRIQGGLDGRFYVVWDIMGARHLKKTLASTIETPFPAE